MISLWLQLQGNYNERNKRMRTKVLDVSVWSYYSVLMSVLETAENERGEKLLRRIRGFDCFACEASFHSSCHRQYPRIPTQMTKTREGRRTLKSHIGQPSRKFVMWLKKKNHSRSKNHETFWLMWNVRICFGRDEAVETRLQSRETEKEVREKWHLRADTAILFTEQWREV